MLHPHVLIASDSFKGSLTSAEVASIVAEELHASMPKATSHELYVADGGEGTLEAILTSTSGTRVACSVEGPLGAPVDACFGRLPGERVIIEAASANGLTLLREDERDVMHSSTRGVGQLIAAALDAGARNLTLGIGGSATNDGGAGMLSALGARLLDRDRHELKGCACDLIRLAEIDISQMDSRLAACTIRVMCDVDNPLLGPFGATAVFGSQKGATVSERAELERGMENFAACSARALGVDASCAPGTGAAGGLGFALHAFLGAELQAGIECVLDLVGFDEALASADLCITGEGHFDMQTAAGKVVAGIAKRCKQAGKPCIALVGGADVQAVEVGLPGISAIVPTVSDACSIEDAMEHAERNLRLAARRTFSLLAAGASLAVRDEA